MNKELYEADMECVSRAWDSNIRIRANDLECGTDITYTNVILPWTLREVSRLSTEKSSILDIGCGCGYLTNAIYQSGRPDIRGIDISPISIAYAQTKYPHISFLQQNFYSLPLNKNYNLCLAVMTLNNMPDMSAFFEVAHAILCNGGYLIIILPHPCFWTEKHISTNEFQYMMEKSYKTTFSTKGRKDYNSPILYFHRPIESYLRCIREHGFSVTLCQELVESPTETIPDLLGMVLTKSALSEY